MKKLLYITKSQNGFIFIYVTFLTALILLVTFTSITLYVTDKQLTYVQLEQIELETLHQMAFREAKDEGVYYYPNGYVTVEVNRTDGNQTVYILNAFTHDGNQKTRVYREGLFKKNKKAE